MENRDSFNPHLMEMLWITCIMEASMEEGYTDEQ